MDTPATRIKEFRQRAKLSATALSLQAGLSASHVGQIERGKCRRISLETLQSIANALGISVGWLVDGKPPTAPAESVPDADPSGPAPTERMRAADRVA